MPKTVNVYDFDKTIYPGDSMVDFYIYNVLRNPLLLRFLPSQLWHITKFGLGREDRTTVKTNFFRYLKGVKGLSFKVDMFWDARLSKLEGWYTKKDHSSDVILTASPEFLIARVAKELGVSKLIATKMDPATGKITGQNCYGEEKVRRLQAELPGVKVAEAYGDRDSDLPVLRLAEKPFLVQHGNVTNLKI